MNAPSPAIARQPLHLYDFTHGQRRLTVWPEYGRDGKLAVHAAIAVPVTLQCPGEPPETDWVIVTTARSRTPKLVTHRSDVDNYRMPIAGERLLMSDTEIALLPSEAEMLTEYLMLDDAEVQP